MMNREPEKEKRRKKHRDGTPKSRDKDRDKDRPSRPKSSRSTRSRDSEPTTSDLHHNSEKREKKSSRSHTSRSSAKMAATVPEIERSASRTSLPYPSFSKAHSREAVGSKETLEPTSKPSNITPDPTDLGQHGRSKPEPAAHKAHAAPPSPPLTAAEDADLRRSRSGNSMRKSKENDEFSGRRSVDSTRLSHDKYSRSRSSLRESTIMDEASEFTKGTEYSRVSGDTPKKPPHIRPLSPNTRPPGGRSTSVGSHKTLSTVQSHTDSDATVGPERQARKAASHLSYVETSPPSAIDSAPQTPIVQAVPYPHIQPHSREPTPIEVFTEDASALGDQIHTINVGGPPPPPMNGGMMLPPPPPPPPPPPMFDLPRVDYLLQNGGLPHPVSRSLLNQKPALSYQQYNSPRVGTETPANRVQTMFAPLETLLEDYRKVMEKNGSIAVATGYRSVARRLLDRLESVFARNISEERCHCIICRTNASAPPQTEEETGVSWGEILEYVSGRRELPMWPPFSLAPATSGLGIDASGRGPMQKIDPDVPAEYREHYVRQSKKTKSAVQKWLTGQPEEPPPDVDDATLAFAIVTKLDEDKRPYFTALLRGQTTLPGPRSVTPLDMPQPELMKKTGLALQRLYRLGQPPRNPECAIFLLKYPVLHPVLATLAVVSPGEWEILVSGRFDGFLWSGAESGSPGGMPPSRGPSRGPTPISRNHTPFSPGPSRGPTPFQGVGISRGPTPAPGFGAPVQMDEETEIAVLAEVEREIYLGMEALEDAFERLHMKAETVRSSLRERSAGLAQAAQARRGPSLDDDDMVRMGTPASAFEGFGDRWDSETDDGIDDDAASLAPDDSASNISYNRHRRRVNRGRKTPAVVVEEDETVFDEDVR